LSQFVYSWIVAIDVWIICL